MVIQVKNLQSRTAKWGLGAGLVLTGAITAIAGTAYASASVPAQRTIYGCYTQSNGALNIRDKNTGRTCKRGQRPISWNKQGIPGPQGPPGAATAGPSGLDIIYVQGPTIFGQGPSETVDCPSDHPYAVSGGVRGSTDPPPFAQPVDDPNGPAVGPGQMNAWYVSTDLPNATLYGWVMCAK